MFMAERKITIQEKIELAHQNKFDELNDRYVTEE